MFYNAPDYTVKLCVATGHDPRCYNLPTANEVGVIFSQIQGKRKHDNNDSDDENKKREKTADDETEKNEE